MVEGHQCPLIDVGEVCYIKCPLRSIVDYASLNINYIFYLRIVTTLYTLSQVVVF